MKEYRVWTKNAFRSASPITDWMTRAQCKRFILARWGHWPCWAYISKAANLENFIRYNGE